MTTYFIAHVLLIRFVCLAGLADLASADDGDDFANNLITDLGP